MAHIHQGAAGQTGGPVFTLTQVADALSDFSLMGNFTKEQIETLLNDEYYINVHSSTHASGELRGQLMPDDDDGDMHHDGTGDGTSAH